MSVKNLKINHLSLKKVTPSRTHLIPALEGRNWKIPDFEITPKYRADYKRAMTTQRNAVSKFKWGERQCSSSTGPKSTRGTFNWGLCISPKQLVFQCSYSGIQKPRYVHHSVLLIILTVPTKQPVALWTQPHKLGLDMASLWTTKPKEATWVTAYDYAPIGQFIPFINNVSQWWTVFTLPSLHYLIKHFKEALL